MQPHRVQPLAEWRERVAGYGYGGGHYPHSRPWDESFAYEFSAVQMDDLWSAATSVYERMVELTESEVCRNQLSGWNFLPQQVREMCRTWDKSDHFPTLFTRLDFVLNANGKPSLVGLEAEYPRLLVPSAVTQWEWVTQAAPWASQFNEIHERLCAACREYQFVGRTLHVGYRAGQQHEMISAEYVKSVACSVGVDARTATFESVIYDQVIDSFRDDQRERIDILVLMGPLDSLGGVARDAVYEHSTTCVVEPSWKQLWSDPAWLPFLLAKSSSDSWAQGVTGHTDIRCAVWIVAGEASGLVVYDRAGVSYPHFFS